MYEDLVEQRQVAPYEEPRSDMLLRCWVEVDWAELRLPAGCKVRGDATASRAGEVRVGVAPTSSYPARKRGRQREQGGRRRGYRAEASLVHGRSNADGLSWALRSTSAELLTK